MKKPSPSTSTNHQAAEAKKKPSPSTSTSHQAAEAKKNPSPSTSTSHQGAKAIAFDNDKAARRRGQEAAIKEAKQFGIDNYIDYDKEDAAAVDASMISLPTKFFGLHLVDETTNFYYDGDKIQDYNKEAEERQHLKKSSNTRQRVDTTSSTTTNETSAASLTFIHCVDAFDDSTL